MRITHVRMQVDVRWVTLPGRGEALRGSRAGLWEKTAVHPKQRSHRRVGRRDGGHQVWARG